MALQVRILLDAAPLGPEGSFGPCQKIVKILVEIDRIMKQVNLPRDARSLA